MATQNKKPDALAPLKDAIFAFVMPAVLWSAGVYFCLITAVTNPLLLITDVQAFRHRAFSKLWAVLGKKMSEEMPPGTAEAVNSLSGTVLDLGPGNGSQLHLYNPKKITKIYGIEPAVDLHDALLASAKEAGFKEGQYEIINAGAEPQSLIPALSKKGLLSSQGSGSTGTFDGIACLRVLCGVPHLQETVDNLYQVLKPGGKIVLSEHVVNPYPDGGSFIGRNVQRLYMLCGWSVFMGGCCLDRDIKKTVKDAARHDGGWKIFDVKINERYATLPHIVGEAVKK